MNRPAVLFACLALACAPRTSTPTEPAEPAPAPEPAPEATTTLSLDAEGGTITVTPVYHGTAMIEVGDTVVWLDPWSKADLEGKPTADVLLVTDVHQDHLDPEAIASVTDAETVIVAPRAVADTLEREVAHVLANGESATLDGLTVTAVPMYNLVRGPETGGLFHEKGRGNGYLLTFGGKTVYFAGDTECTDEMKALSGVDMAFVPMNLPYTMPPSEAAACAAAFAPAIVVPYHYAGSDLAEFAAGLEGVEGVTYKQVEFYPGGLPF